MTYHYHCLPLASLGFILIKFTCFSQIFKFSCCSIFKWSHYLPGSSKKLPIMIFFLKPANINLSLICINFLKENFGKQVSFVIIINSFYSNSYILAPWRGLPSCLCTAVMSTGKPVRSAAWPETRTAPGMAPLALATSLLQRGRKDIRNKQKVCYLSDLISFLKQLPSYKYTNFFSINKKRFGGCCFSPLFLSQNNQKNV